MLGDILFFILFFFIILDDIQYMIIREKYLIPMLFISIFINYTRLDNVFIGMAIYSLPLVSLIWLETYLSKEIIGMGDIKLSIVIGGYIANNSLYILYLFYNILFIISGCIALIIYLRTKKGGREYIPFAPMLFITSLIVRFYEQFI